MTSDPIFTIWFCGNALNVTKECIGVNSMVSMLALSAVLEEVRRMWLHRSFSTRPVSASG